VVDHGIGIKSSDLPHIFDRFYRAETSRSKAGGDGYGLGLAIAKSIVELHGGEISVKSTPGKGSEFVVKLIL
jgi:two-component system OmpR family sensor kinase